MKKQKPFIERIEIEIVLMGSKKDKDIKKVMKKLNDTLFLIPDYAIIRTKIRRGIIEKIVRIVYRK